jgi:hypothetical protein
MTPNNRQQSPDNDNNFPAPFSYRMGTRERFIPINMREGRPERLLKAAIALSTWAKGNVQDVDTYRAFESAYCLLADDLDEVNCPHNTIVKVFYAGFRRNERAQFRWFLRGVQFPRQFSHPVAQQERHSAAQATFPRLLEDDIDLRRYLLFAQADEIGMRIGIDFLDLPARRIAYHDMDEYITNFPSHNFDEDEDEIIRSPSPQHPATPTLPILNKLPKNESPQPDPRPPHLPPSVRALINAIKIHRTINQREESSSHAYTSRGHSTRSPQLTYPSIRDNESVNNYGNSTTDPMHPDSYDW